MVDCSLSGLSSSTDGNLSSCIYSGSWLWTIILSGLSSGSLVGSGSLYSCVASTVLIWFFCCRDLTSNEEDLMLKVLLWVWFCLICLYLAYKGGSPNWLPCFLWAIYNSLSLSLSLGNMFSSSLSFLYSILSSFRSLISSGNLCFSYGLIGGL